MQDIKQFIEVVINGVVLPIYITQEMLSIVNSSIEMNRILKYKDCLIKNENILEENAYNYIRNKELDYLVDPILDYVDPNLRNIVMSNFGNIDITKKLVETSLGNGGYNLDRLKSNCYSLVHAASFSYLNDENIILSGFMQQHNNASIGRFLNNSYAVLLTNRIFGDLYKNLLPKSYTEIVSNLEKTFATPDEMERLFFTHDLPGLINHLEKFMSRKDAICLLFDMDSYHFDRMIYSPMSIIDRKVIDKKIDSIQKKIGNKK